MSRSFLDTGQGHLHMKIQTCFLHLDTPSSLPDAGPADPLSPKSSALARTMRYRQVLRECS